MSIAGLSTVRSSLTTFRNLFNMSGQAKISNFFRPMGQKRENTDAQTVNKQDNKKSKVMKENRPADEEENISSTPSSSPPESATPLTPEQKSKMKSNQLAAKMKLTEKKTNGLVQHMGATWFKALEAEFSKPYFDKLATFVQNERKSHTIYPPAHQVFTFTTACEIEDVKVVILGQDPYHGPRQAHGLCFSVQQGVPPPPSLLNMYKELEKDIEGFKRPNHGYLQGWSNQGVLLLNAVLTVKAANANSHKDRGWEKFTDAVIAWINNNSKGVVFMLWGAYAQKKGACIDKKKHHILKGVHPSPLSAHRGFFGCKHFSQCNDLLEEQGKKSIDWSDLPQQ